MRDTEGMGSRTGSGAVEPAAVPDGSRAALGERIDSEMLLATMLQGVVYQGADGAVLWMNAAAERILGKTREEFLGETSVSVEHHTIHEDGSPFPGLEHPAMVALRTGREVHGVPMGVYNPRERDYRWINVSAVPVREPGTSRPGHVYTLFDDITDRKRAEEAVRKSEERLRLAISAGAMATWDWHVPSGEVTWNDEHFRMLGYEPGEVAPSYQAWAERVHPEDRAATEALVRASVEQGADYRGEFRSLMPDGTVRWIEARGRIARDAAGRPMRQYGVMLDITDRKRSEEALRQSERLYRAIGESIDYGIWVCAPDGRNTYASESFLKLVGLTEEQCSNFGWGNVLHPDDAERTIAAWQDCVRTGGVWDIEHRVRGVDGRWHPILARGVPVKDERGAIVCWAGINLDISQLKRAEAELRDREAALREIDSQKNRFLAVLSHELRNPLTPITNSLYILDHAAPGGDQASRAKAVLARQVAQLTRLVDDLLDATRIVSGKLHLQRSRFDLAQLLRRTADDHRSAFADADVALDVRVGLEPVWMVGDESRIAQATGNLLGNSNKFTAAGGRVVLALEVDPETATGAILVRDTGVGIHGDLLHRVFEPFVQADSSLDRSKSGLGLGLALVKSVAELHGGTVVARSDGPGRGAEFVVRVPVELQVVELPASDRAASDRPPPRRVLVIEDNRDAADSLRDLLEFGGHEVEVAYSGPDGIRKAKAFGPELVFCDIGLPGMNGYDVARSFRADPVLRSTRLVALSGYAQPEDQQRAARVGFDGHMAKPPSMQKLEAVLKALSKRPASQAE